MVFFFNVWVGDLFQGMKIRLRHFSNQYSVSLSDYKATYVIWEILVPFFFFLVLIRDSGGSGSGDEGTFSRGA